MTNNFDKRKRKSLYSVKRVDIPNELHQKLKIYAAENNLYIS